MDIRNGHDQTIQKILNWVKEDGNISGKTVCDCGCGVGSLAIPLALMGEFVIVFILIIVLFVCLLFLLLLGCVYQFRSYL